MCILHYLNVTVSPRFVERRQWIVTMQLLSRFLHWIILHDAIENLMPLPLHLNVHIRPPKPTLTSFAIGVRDRQPSRILRCSIGLIFLVQRKLCIHERLVVRFGWIGFLCGLGCLECSQIRGSEGGCCGRRG